MKEMMNSKENDEICEEGRKILQKLDNKLIKTQERFFKNNNTNEIDEVFFNIS